MSNVAVYKNDMNLVPMRNFTPIEIDLFFTILAQMRDKGTSEITFSFEELKELSSYNITKGIERFEKDLENTYDKLISLNIKIGTPKDWTKFVLFTKYRVNVEEKFVTVATNPEFAHLINNITNNFTKLELQELTSLSSSYSKTAYRLLKQYRKTGYKIFTIDEFKEIMCIPKSYQMCDINKRVLTPIQKELSPYIKCLEINKLSKGRSRKITHIEFVFMAESDFKKDDTKTFRDKDGFYYEKGFLDMTDEEMAKEYPSVPQPQADKYYKK